MRCENCGVTSPLESCFVLRRKSFRTRLYFICPACDDRRSDNLTRTKLALLILIGLGGLIMPDRLIENLSLLLIFEYISIFPHELGHVVGACVANMEVFNITFGRGRVVFDCRVRGTLIEFRGLPVVGAVTCSSLNPVFWRVRRLLVVAGGPIANVLVIALAIRYTGGWKGATATDLSRHVSPAIALAGGNAFLLIGALLGRKVRLGHNDIDSDGRKIRRLLLGPIDGISERRVQYFLANASRLEADSEYKRLAQALEAWRAELPAPVYGFLMGVALSGLGEHQKANAMLRSMLEKHPEPSETRANFLNALAWGHLLIGTSDDFAEAERLSAQAYALLPWSYAVLSTRGWALAETGRPSEGVPLLRRSLDGPLSKRDRATVLCTMAIAEARLERPARARRYLAQASRTDRNCELLARAAANIALCETERSASPAMQNAPSQ
jgi:tetratricopeptide (TPR) repeat protein